MLKLRSNATRWTLRLGLPSPSGSTRRGGQSQDDLLILVEDAVKGHYPVPPASRTKARDEGAIHRRNQQLALAAETLMSHSRRTDKVIPVWELAGLLVGRGLYHSPIPDELHSVLHDVQRPAPDRRRRWLFPGPPGPGKK
jgi:hypothetical protein